jgi:hypothetical protein
VYWVRGAKYAGWGPLAPGEQWDPADEVNAIPQEFLKVNTSYAAFEPSVRTIDPTGFKGLPKDPLKDVEFLAALPSPPFAAAKLDAVRPLVNAASLRVKPVVEGVAIDTAPAPRPERRPPPAPAAGPVVIVTQAAPPPPPVTEVVEVPVPVPAGIVFVATPPRETRRVEKPAAAPATPAPPRTRREKKYRNSSERALAARVLEHLESRGFPKALAELDQWAASYPETDFADERTYYYMLAYHGTNQPAKVVERGSTMVARRVVELFDEPMQALSVAYLTVTDFHRVNRPTRDQSSAARNAARELLSMLPVCFTPERRPEAMTAADWAKSRSELEILAREILSRSTH